MLSQPAYARLFGASPFLTSLLLLFATVGALTFAATAHAAVGRTPGSFAVSPAGSATYTIPIWVQPGPHGLQPNIALTYDSKQKNGYVGIGWSLSGLSSIYRCNRTYAQDGAGAPVKLAASDAFCMDGQRLRLTAGTYGVAGSTYQTEIANFSNVTANGAAGTGPAYFVVQDRKGLIYEYGNGGNSQVLAYGSTSALSWLLNKVSDRAGNTMTIDYTTATGSAVPATISWTPSSHGSSSYNYTMQFAYGSLVNASPTYGYVAGTPIANPNLLSSISIQYLSSTVKKYLLSYQASPTTGRDELSQVLECADVNATNCLAPTVVTYQSGQAGVAPTQTAMLSAGSSTPGYSFFAQYDFNGDGRTDIAYYTSGSWYVALNSGSGFGTPINTGLTTAFVAIGDLLGTGSDGFVADSGGTFYYYRYDSGTNSFSGTSTHLANAGYAYLSLLDIDGDGLPDLVGMNSATSITTIHNSSSAGVPSFDAPYVAYSSGIASNGVRLYTSSGVNDGALRYLDFNGDGRKDLIIQFEVNFQSGGEILQRYQNYELTSNGANAQFSIMQLPSGQQNQNLFFVNWNDDQCTDAVLGPVIYISGCDGSLPTTITLPNSAPVLAAMDWNGDGRTDLVIENASSLAVYLSTGNYISALQSTGFAYSTNQSYFVLDSAGDGLDALAYMDYTTLSHSTAYFAHNAPGQPADLLSKITDGYGNSVSPSYVSIVQSSYAEFTNAVYPCRNFIGPMYVVNLATYSDPTSPPNGTYYQTFYYVGAWLNLQGRGFIGFSAHQNYDSRNGVWETWTYTLDWPYSGMLFGDGTSQNNLNTKLIKNLNNGLTYTVLDNTSHNERYFPYAANSTTTFNEVGGPKDNQLIKTVATNYTYDIYGNATIIATTATDNDSTTPYPSWTTTVTNTPIVDTSQWCLALFTQTQIAYTGPGATTPVNRTKSFGYDLSACNYTSSVTESGSAYQVTETFGFDPFGNINSDTVAGIGMPPRLTSANWGTTGQFPLSVTDAMGSTTHYDYDYSFGVPSSTTDPNGAQTSWQYTDGFGRKTQETRPDSTYTTWVYNDCISYGGCLLGNHTLALAHFVYNSDHSLETDGTTYYDEQQRPLISNDMLLANGTYSRTDTRYDPLGNVISRSAPCTWSNVTTPCPYATVTSYDMVNRVRTITRPTNAGGGTTTQVAYTYLGDTTISTDPYAVNTTVVKDANGWRRKTTDANNYTLTVDYDAAGSPTSVNDSLANTLWSGTYQYGIAPFLVTSHDIDLGNWGYTYDALGERTVWTDAMGHNFGASYDALSRPITRTEPDFYTQWNWGSNPSIHNIGRLASVCTGTGGSCSASYYAESEGYDSVGRLIERAITIPASGTYIYWSSYNTSGLLDTLTYPTSTSGYALQVKYNYQNGFLQSVADISDSPNVTLWTANAINPAGQVSEETLHNGIVTNRTYDDVTHLLGSIQSGIGGGTGVQNQGFLYDPMGNVTQRQDNKRLLTESLCYDSAYRLDHSTLTGSCTSGPTNLQLHYDAMGNITDRSDVAAGATWTYGDAAHKHAVTQAGSAAYQYAYDANGNMTSRQGSSISWSSYNYPLSISAGSGSTAETVALSYGPDRQRWQQLYSGNGITETTDYVGGMLEVVSSGGIDDYRHYVYAGKEPIAVYSRKSTLATPTFSYLLSDHQSSVATITDGSGAAVVDESFAPYGSRRSPTTWSGAASTSDLTTSASITREGYTFQTALGLWMGLNHMNGRVQDAVTGRFLSADPVISEPGNTQNFNRYSYVYNNPVSFADMTGFCVDEVFDGTEGAVIQQVENCPDVPPPDLPDGGQYYLASQQTYAYNGGGGSDGQPRTQPLPPATQVATQTPQGNQQPNPTLCRALGTAAGAVSGAVGGVTFAVATGNVTPAGLAAGALGGAVVGGAVAFVSPDGGFNGAIAAAVGSLAVHTSGGTSAGGFSEVAGDTAGGYASPAFAVPVGAAAGAVTGALTTTGVLGAAGAAGGAFVGATAGGLAAAAALSTNSALSALISQLTGCY